MNSKSQSLSDTTIYRQLFEASRDGIFLINRQGRYVDANPAATAMVGYSLDELRRMTVDDLLMPGAGLPPAARQQAWHEGRIIETTLRHKDGHPVPVEMNISPVNIPDGDPLVLGIAREISDRLKLEQALRFSEEKFSKAFQLSPLLMSLTRMADGLFIEANDNFIHTIGYTREEIIGHTSTEINLFADPQDRARLVSQLQKQGFVEKMQTRVNTRSGEIRHMLISARPIQIQETLCILIVGMDITERVQAEQLLRESEERWRFLSQATNEAVIVHEEGRVVDVNDAGLRMVGYSREELIGQSILRLAHPDSVETILEKIRSGSEEPYEAVGLRKDGSTFPCELHPRLVIWRGQPVRVVLIRDLTAKKQAEQALRRYSQRLQVLHTIDRAILTAESPQAIARAALEHVRELVPCKRASVTIFSPEGAEVLVLAAQVDGQLQDSQPLLAETLELSEELKRGELRRIDDLTNREGQASIYKELLKQGIRSVINIPILVQGELIGTLNLGADQVSAFSEEAVDVLREVADVLGVALQQARLREQLQRYTDELEQRVAERTRALEERTAEIEKLNRGMLAMLEDLQETNRRYEQLSQELQAVNAELKTFAYTVSHDLKAPLRGIDGYSRFLMEDYIEQLDEEGRFFLTNIRQAVRQMNQLIDDLLAYSRMERRTLTPRTFSLVRLVEGLLAEKRAEIEAGGVTISRQIECPEITADSDGLTIALRNLIDNAIKYSASVASPHIEIGARREGDHCLIWVKDNGIGFDMQFQERIFEIFQRLHTTEEYSGTGVGLAIVRKAIQRMGGRIWAESMPGQGAVFYLKIPQPITAGASPSPPE